MADVNLPIHIIKGRGAATRLPHRCEKDSRAAYDDGCGTLKDAAVDAPRLATQVMFEDARSVNSRNDSPDIFFDHSINPYRSCEHGCIYCDARPTHSYLNLSPGLDFETKIIAKRNIAEVLRRDLARLGYVPRLLNIGSNTDCYQPVEREPFVNEDMEQVLQAAWDAAFYTVIRLLLELSPLFRQWLDLHYPQCAARIMSRIQEMRAGKDYDSDFASRMKGSGLWADLIRQRFAKTCHRLGFNRERVELDLSQFRPALAHGQSEMF